MTTFYLGTHQPHWLGLVGVPLFISRRRLGRRKTFPRAKAPWALDSGGFSELSLYGTWRTSAAQYASEVRCFRDRIGRLQWAAAQDWMCEPQLCALTFPGLPHRLAVEWHQALTVANFAQLRSLAPDLPFVPVLQGWTEREYLDHVEHYDRAGFDLRAEPLVGLGSVCRRQHTGMVERLVARLSRGGIRLHGFGFKIQGLRRVAGLLVSADSGAWGVAARRSPPLPECVGKHKNCANCHHYALMWRERVLKHMLHSTPRQGELELEAS